MNNFWRTNFGLKTVSSENRAVLNTLSNSKWGMRLLECLVLLWMTLLLKTPAEAMSGREVYEKVRAFQVKSLDRKTQTTMVLFDKKGKERKRTLTEYSKKGEGETYKVRIVFNSPSDLEGVGFLLHAHTFTDHDLWAYFPEYKRVRRIATNSRDDAFFGSDFSYDDFGGPPNLDDYKFDIKNEDVIDNRPCYVIEVIPKTQRKYTQYIAWVAKDLWIPLKIDYYKGEDIYRCAVFQDIRLIDGIPTPFTLKMEDMKTGHRTELTIQSIQYNTQFSDEQFSQQSLERAEK